MKVEKLANMREFLIRNGITAGDMINYDAWVRLIELLERYESYLMSRISPAENSLDFVHLWVYKATTGQASSGEIADALDAYIKEELLSFRKYFNSNSYGHIDESDVQGYLDNKE